MININTSLCSMTPVTGGQACSCDLVMLLLQGRTGSDFYGFIGFQKKKQESQRHSVEGQGHALWFFSKQSHK